MTTPAITGPAAITQNMAASTRQSDGASSDMPFNQVLSREVADRNNASEASKVSAKDTNAPAQQNQTPSPGADKSKASATDNVEQTDQPAKSDDTKTADAASAEMLALVNNLMQANAVNPGAPPIAAPEGGAKGGGAIGSIGATNSSLTAKNSMLPTDLAGTQVPNQTLKTNPDNVSASADPALQADIANAQASTGQTPKTNFADAAALADQALKTALAKAPALPNQAVAPKPDGVQTLPGKGIATAVPAASALDVKKPPNSTPSLTDNRPVVIPGAKDLGIKPDNGAAIASNPGTETKILPDVSAAAKLQEASPGQSAVPAIDLNTLNAQDAKVTPTANMLGAMQQTGIIGAEAAGHSTERLNPPVGSAGWDQALGQKVVWMVAGGQQSASLTLNPPDLGPLQVVLNVSNSHASATFTAAQPEVRQALEAALPKLREMMADSGIQLGQASVSAGSPNQFGAPGNQSQPSPRRLEQMGNFSDVPIVVAARPIVQSGGQGLIDTFV